MALKVELEKRLGDFNLQVRFETDREPFALLGASGSGKSVTLRCIAGIMRPDAGHIELNGVTLFDSARCIDLPPQKRRVGYLFQQYALFPNMTAAQNIGAAIPDKRERERVTAEYLRRFRLTDAADLCPAQLSGGQQQRTALARILASRPAAVLLDEPFSALDSHLRDGLELELADTLADFGGPVVWVSHDRGEVRRNCRRVCVLEQGTSQEATTVEELFASPATVAAARLAGWENVAQVIAQNGSLFVPDWGVTLEDSAEAAAVAIRSADLRFTGPGIPIPCRLRRQMPGENGTVLVLEPRNGEAGALLKLQGEETEPYPIGAEITVFARPEGLQLLK